MLFQRPRPSPLAAQVAPRRAISLQWSTLSGHVSSLQLADIKLEARVGTSLQRVFLQLFRAHKLIRSACELEGHR